MFNVTGLISAEENYMTVTKLQLSLSSKENPGDWIWMPRLDFKMLNYVNI